MNETNGKKLLFTVADILEDLNVEFFLCSGTLLGAVRDKKFIGTDRNVDLKILQEDLIPIAKELENRLIRKGINVKVIDHRHRRPWNGSVYAFKLSGYGVRAELASFIKIKGMRALPSHLNDYWIVLPPRFVEELDEIEFYGRTFKCPRNIDEYLTRWLGDWRIPARRGNSLGLNIKPESWRDDITAEEK